MLDFFILFQAYRAEPNGPQPEASWMKQSGDRPLIEVKSVDLAVDNSRADSKQEEEKVAVSTEVSQVVPKDPEEETKESQTIGETAPKEEQPVNDPLVNPKSEKISQANTEETVHSAEEFSGLEGNFIEICRKFI